MLQCRFQNDRCQIVRMIPFPTLLLRNRRGIFRFMDQIYRQMSDKGTTHLERTVSSSRETVEAVGTVVEVTNLSKTVKKLTINIPDKRFKFKAGQWVDFSIPGLQTVGGFSMCSSPGKLHEHRLVDLAVKRSDHPPALWVHTECHVGSQVGLKVGGDFLYDPVSAQNPNHLLLVAGGVGINPLYSMIQCVRGSLEHDSLARDNTKVSLLYSASSVDELIFRAELGELTCPSFACHFFVTQEGSAVVPDTKIKIGRITLDALEDAIKEFDMNKTTAYLCGPQPMLHFVTETLLNLGLNKNYIKKEEWW